MNEIKRIRYHPIKKGDTKNTDEKISKNRTNKKELPKTKVRLETVRT